jgi:IS30 family transposase
VLPPSGTLRLLTGDLWRHLRCQKKRRKHVGAYDRRGKIPNQRSIEERPEIVEQRTRLGDWEVDLMVALIFDHSHSIVAGGFEVIS